MDPLPALKVEFAPSRTAHADALRGRCKRKRVEKEALLWKNAWKRFKIESDHFIPPPKCFPISDKDAKKNRKNYVLEYRILAVKHFLPYYKRKLPFLTGDIKRRYQKVISFLNLWKTEIPEKLRPITQKKKESVKLAVPSPLPQSMLPTPPMFKSITPTRTIEQDEAHVLPCSSFAGKPGELWEVEDSDDIWEGVMDFENRDLPCKVL